jgi:hypothetical protein
VSNDLSHLGSTFLTQGSFPVRSDISRARVSAAAALLRSVRALAAPAPWQPLPRPVSCPRSPTLRGHRPAPRWSTNNWRQTVPVGQAKTHRGFLAVARDLAAGFRGRGINQSEPGPAKPGLAQRCDAQRLGEIMSNLLASGVRIPGQAQEVRIRPSVGPPGPTRLPASHASQSGRAHLEDPRPVLHLAGELGDDGERAWTVRGIDAL